MTITSDETRQLCITLTAVVGLLGAVFTALRVVIKSRWITGLAGLALTVGLFGVGFVLWRVSPELPVISTRPFVGHKSVWEKVAEYLEKRSSSEQAKVRVISLVPLANRTDVSDESLAACQAALKEWAALPLSAGGAGGSTLTPLNEEQTLFALHLDDARMDAVTWDRRLSGYEYGVRMETHPDPAVRKSAEIVYAATKTELPIVRGDWLLAASGRTGKWRTDYERPLGSADLAAELGLTDVAWLTAWLTHNADRTARLGLAALTHGETVPRTALAKPFAGDSVYQNIAHALKLGYPVTITADVP